VGIYAEMTGQEFTIGMVALVVISLVALAVLRKLDNRG
jgi:hypothetical protein